MNKFHILFSGSNNPLAKGIELFCTDPDFSTWQNDMQIFGRSNFRFSLVPAFSSLKDLQFLENEHYSFIFDLSEISNSEIEFLNNFMMDFPFSPVILLFQTLPKVVPDFVFSGTIYGKFSMEENCLEKVISSLSEGISILSYGILEPGSSLVFVGYSVTFIQPSGEKKVMKIPNTAEIIDQRVGFFYNEDQQNDVSMKVYIDIIGGNNQFITTILDSVFLSPRENLARLVWEKKLLDSWPGFQQGFKPKEIKILNKKFEIVSAEYIFSGSENIIPAS